MDGDRTSVPATTGRLAHLARRRWARRLIDPAPGAPAYGSREWLALPDGPEKVAAVVRAAECWATDGDELRTEVAALAAAHKRAEDAAYVVRRDAHRETWRHLRPAATPAPPRDLYDVGRGYMRRGRAS